MFYNLPYIWSVSNSLFAEGASFVESRLRLLFRTEELNKKHKLLFMQFLFCLPSSSDHIS